MVRPDLTLHGCEQAELRCEGPVPCTSISPMLSVRRGAKAIEFYKSAFGAKESFRIDAPDGAVVARLSVEGAGAEFWVADESPEHQNFSPETLNDATARPDAVFARAVAAGATVVWPVADQYGWRLGQCCKFRNRTRVRREEVVPRDLRRPLRRVR